MAYITREDGEHFVIPSYRDVLTAKQKRLLKKDILLLSQSYGEFITLQRKSATQYEVAFSPDTGYLLGESIWHHFKRPLDMIYCEAIPNTTEAILVIVKAGSVYLDGSFPVESIPEELIIFLTQQNNFEIYTYGDVPISQVPEEGKFSFDTSSVKSFTVLDSPVFPSLALLKIYQLQPVELVLKTQGIGVFPTRQVLTGIVVVGLLWMGWSYLSARREEIMIPTVAPEANPYQVYNDALTSPAPDETMAQFIAGLKLLFTIPGWSPGKVDFINGVISSSVISDGGKVEALFNWAKSNNAKVDIRANGIYVLMSDVTVNRPVPKAIYPLKQVLGDFIDRLTTVYPGNHMNMGEIVSKGLYSSAKFTIAVNDVSPTLLLLIGEQFKDLPFVLNKVSLTVDDGSLTGSINLEALGS